MVSSCDQTFDEATRVFRLGFNSLRPTNEPEIRAAELDGVVMRFNSLRPTNEPEMLLYAASLNDRCFNSLRPTNEPEIARQMKARPFAPRFQFAPAHE